MANNWIFNSEMIPLLERSLASEHFADAADHLALDVVESEEFETVAQALAVADDGADFQGIGTEGKRDFEGDDFSGFEFAGESGGGDHDAGIGRGGATGFAAVCEFATGDEGERQRGGASGECGDDHGSEEFRGDAECSGSGECGRCGE